ncbi:MAG TPA: DUF2892 domain-containing protein [Ignavibacteriales bacterium]|nr:DUF2892 domain-containing protein [Ignavibacteriales bacterium]HOL81352.1 DUF2892 domain-containing protein [Ignavibacteriales bacterium]HOM65468.1 DUF2892 domain-containing protein [Ignavibacteriales bacterium]HPD67714.1 DUF2892 domain-containing protein [Ignavibacteriales bacterium]HPP33879.1 DUF2892 domain-containing protein [Ignavibacteriales bacterium]
MKNVGKIDRIIRVFVGLVILILLGLLETWWALVGLIPLLTGIFGYCPLYSLFKLNTCEFEQNDK